MASMISVALAGFIHLVLRYSLFLDPAKPNTPGPALPTVLVCLAMLDLIYDNRLFPRSYSGSVPVAFEYVCETAIGLFLLEVSMIVFWATIEHVTYLISKILLVGMGVMSGAKYDNNEDLIVGCITIPISIFILAMAGQATDHFHLLRECYESVHTHAALKLDDAMRYLSRSNREQRMLVSSTYRNYDAAIQGKRGGRFATHFSQ